MSTDEKFENAKDSVAGKAKEGFGKVTGDRETETEGKVQQGKAEVRDAVQDARDTTKGAAEGVFGDDHR